MKFKLKIGDILLLLGTAAAIILSIVLWIFIMTNDQRFSQLKQANNTLRSQEKMRNTKSLYDMYIPTSSFGYRNGKLYRLYDSKNNLSFEFTKDLKNLKVQNIQLKVSDQDNYEKLLNDPDYLQLTYPDQITLNLFINKKDNRQFNRIFISNATNKWIYVGDDRKSKLYKLDLKNANFDRLRDYAKKAHYHTEANFVKLKSGYAAFYGKSQKWSIYSYLTSRQSDSYFVSKLLGTSGVSSRTNKHGRTTYSLNYYTRLSVPKSNANKHDYLYTHYEKNHLTTVTDRLLDSVYYVHRLGLMEQDLRFFDAEDGSVKYINYVEGLPVFLNKHDVQVDTNFSSDSVTVAFNSTNLQIPVPFDGQTTTLEPTSKVIEKLKQHGLTQNNIENILVGDQIENDKTHDNLVNLVPTYYVRAYGKWMSADEWLKQDLSVYQSNKDQQERNAS